MSFFINVGKVANVSSRQSVGDDNSNDSCSDLVTIGKLCCTEVYRVIRDINTSKSSGLDNVSSFIVKEAFSILTPEITHLYNLSLTTVTFPQRWKKSTNYPHTQNRGSHKYTKLQAHLPFTATG